MASTLDKSTKLVTAWRMAKKMNGINSEHKIRNISINGTNIDTNEEKAEVFAKAFSDISSNNNYNNNFQSGKQNIELNHKDLYANNSDFTNADHLKSLKEPFDLHELRSIFTKLVTVWRMATSCEKSKSSQHLSGVDKISYEMLQKLPKCATKALYNQNWIR